MQVRRSSDKQQQIDLEWLREFAKFLNRNGNKEKFEVVKKIFVETYLENIREGMNPKDALQKAKSVALCFLVLQQ
ncbi:MAG: hypothetical protein NTZ75_07825 [Euryarchaeota archaeon]|nr:hypothetical protein [Euryarchaeota archaeon]